MKKSEHSDAALQQLLASHYQKLELRDTKLNSLLAMTEHSASQLELETEKQSTHARQLPARAKGIAIAATLLMISLISVFLMTPTGQTQQRHSNNLAMLVSQEVALNHNKGLLPEFTALDYAGLAGQMNKLDFTPLQPNDVDITDLQLIGARYCSIQGQLASQIKLLDSNGHHVTLYQTQLNNKLRSLPDANYHTDGVFIQQWQEDGVFFSLAKHL